MLSVIFVAALYPWSPRRFSATQPISLPLRMTNIEVNRSVNAADFFIDTNQEKIRSWLEAYVSQKPGTIASNYSSEPPFPNLAFHIWADKLHKVDSNVVLSQTIDIKLPWTGGRHALSVLSLPHSSVSLFHFLMVPLSSKFGSLNIQSL